MGSAGIAAVLALGAAVFIAIGDVMHQRQAHEVTDEPVGHVELFLRLLRDRRWWLGSAVSAIMSRIRSSIWHRKVRNARSRVWYLVSSWPMVLFLLVLGPP